MTRDGDAGAAHERLEDVLVHAHRGSEHAGADVGDARELAEALDGAVLPERAVEDGQHDVDRPERGGRGIGRHRQRFCRRCGPARLRAPVAGRKRPATVTADLDRPDVVP